MPSHGHRVFIETTRAGSPDFILRTKSPRLHRRSTSDERVYILQDDVDTVPMATMHISRDALYRENHLLKAELRDKEGDLNQHRIWVQQLQRQNNELRRSLDSTADVDTKVRELRRKNSRLENENSSLKIRVRELTRQLKDAVDGRVSILKARIESLTKEVGDWRHRYDDLDRRYEDLDRRYQLLGRNLDVHAESNRRLTAENELLSRQIEIEARIRRRRG
ncbi:hypothetical protein B0T24DRAFT_322935 [Lasiosphaeria ovina]|uniref:Uncharacterized protein n=1 Tax=Lasiosphaeria ovina TaxID=92902 RepID=A0AAE0K8T7_9PEZI|nr:hypothetical protein B0T24DRAFT_322935 [Lasiosphaeria ovina]